MCDIPSAFVMNDGTVGEICKLTGLNVWGQSQEVLEQQALHEIEILSNEASKKNDNLEDGEIVKNSSAPEQKEKQTSKKNGIVLDINEFIKRQEELKKLKECKKSLEVSEKSRNIAKQIPLKTKPRKRNISVSEAEKHTKKVKTDICYKTKEKNKDISEKSSDSEYIPSDDYSDSDFEDDAASIVNKESQIKKKTNSIGKIIKVKDDGCLDLYKARLDLYYKELENEQNLQQLNDYDKLDDVVLKGGLKIPVKAWANLYSYQQHGLEWLWKLHQMPIGGLLGDEMGLGKTVQVIVFLMSLQYSRVVSGRYTGLGPTVIVCPATVIHQWVKHFHEWAPEIRVAILHQSGTYTGNKANLIKDMNKDKGVLITTYSGILKFKGNLLEYNWHYIILDEGHKIRNPGAKVSIAVKQFRTPHRLLLTGSPMQNNLQELWSLFDFIIPGILGTLQTFMEHFAHPIMQGGYHNATHVQEATAQSVATTLKDIISPYLLRRSKAEVQKYIQLPHKSEQVLFCSLTDEQYDLYKGFLMSDHVSQILGRGGRNWFSENHVRANVLVAITALRKICNHPDLYIEEVESNNNMFDEKLPAEERYGYYKRSGKMVVVSALLKMWKKQQHRVLLFTQSRNMITIFEEFLNQQGYKYLKMDGSTSVNARQPLIDKFNQDNSYDVFLLTTRVGGLGINLTGADRVIIYDPDWNPATDTQARERAWRIGQERQVTVYRLISAGTIEEKMYQRQVWKQLLSNKVLLDPRTQKFFKTSDLYDLFSLQEQNKFSNPETTNIFRESRINMQERLEQKQQHKEKDKEDTEVSSIQFSDEKIQAMKKLAEQIAKNISLEKDSCLVKKSSYQLEIEEEREKRLKEKAELKKLTPSELRTYNRKKLEPKADETNILDDQKVEKCTFEKALTYSEKTAKLYNDLKSGRLKEDSLSICSNSSEGSKNDKERKEETIMSTDKKKSDQKKRIKIDTTGEIDGEKIEGLVRREIKKKERKKEKITHESQDMYILEKLFSKKGVHSALKHDEVIGSSSSKELERIRISSEAKRRADLALEALRKSRLKKWRW